MIRKSTIVLLGFFAVLVLLAVSLQNKWFSGGVHPTPTATAIPAMLASLSEDQLISIELSGGASQHLLLVKQGNDWQIKDPQGVTADQGKVQQLLSALYGITPQETQLSVTSLEAYGITPSSSQIILTASSGSILTIKVGSMTPTQNGYYLQVGSQPAVIVTRYGLEDALNLLNPLALVPETPTP